MRILLLGDVHGNERWLERSIVKAHELGVDQILQLGDFGFWEHDRSDNFMDVAFRLCDEWEVALDWIDGNHECHPVLRSRYGPTGDRRDDNTTADGWFIRWPWLRHRPRGSRWTWGNVRFAALGGAYSIDKPYRRVGKSWWHEETITEDEVDRTIAGGPADVLVCHDVPDEATIAMSRVRGWKSHPLTDANRRRLERVRQALRPRLVVHGHYHVRYREELDDGTIVHGLASDGEGVQSWGLLDTRTLTVRNVGAYDRREDAQ